MSVNFRSLLGKAWKISFLVGLLVGAHYLGDWIIGQFTPYLTPSTEPALHHLIMTAITFYILLMMLPFVPGVEIGIGMMMTFGSGIAPLVYGATVLALSLSFLIGRLIPQETIIMALDKCRLNRTADLLKNLHSLGPEERVKFILRNSSPRITRYFVKYRFLALMIALNIPGNALVGGGGGICLAAGFCRLFSFPGFLLAVILAVAPVPLAVFLTG